MSMNDYELRRDALRAWDAAVDSYRRSRLSRDIQPFTDYARSLELLDKAWRAAGLPLPLYPSIVAWPWPVVLVGGQYR